MRFRLVVLLIFGFLYCFLAYSLCLPLEPLLFRLGAGSVLLSLVLVVLWVPLVFWQQDSDETTITQRRLLWVAFCSMGVLSFSFAISVVREVAAIFTARELHTPEMSEWIFLASVVLFVLGLIKAQHGVAVRKVKVSIAGLAPRLSGFRIILISDLHVGPTIRRSFVEKVVRIANSAKPDLIAFTGDAVDGSVKELSVEVEPLRELQARCGKFYVTGNHEFYWEGPQWIDKLRELGFVPLNNESQLIEFNGETFAIGGVLDPAAQMAGMGGPDFARAAASIPDSVSFRLALCHQPKFASDAEKAGFTLQLSGHTHGGQFFPWTWVASWVHRFNYGLHRFERMWIYVSRGTGYWGPPVRMGSPAEVTLLILDPQ